MQKLPSLTIGLTVFASLAATLSLLTSHLQAEEPGNVDSLAAGLQPFLTALSGEQDHFEMSGTVRVPIDGKPADPR